MCRVKFGFAIGAALLSVNLSAPVCAAAAGSGVATAQQSYTNTVEKVHWRTYRHCHKRKRHGRWDRWCHGPHYGYGYYPYSYDYDPYSYGYYPYYGPGISLYFGHGFGHHHHHRHFHHRH